MYNASRDTSARTYFLQGETKDDLQFTLDDLEKVNVGDDFTIVVTITVRHILIYIFRENYFVVRLQNKVNAVRTLDVTLCPPAASTTTASTPI